MIEKTPFMLRLSKHEAPFYSNLLVVATLSWKNRPVHIPRDNPLGYDRLLMAKDARYRGFMHSYFGGYFWYSPSVRPKRADSHVSLLEVLLPASDMRLLFLLMLD